MAFVTIDTFTFRSDGFISNSIRESNPDGPYVYTMTVQYDSVSDKFKVSQVLGTIPPSTGNRSPMVTYVNVQERGKSENQEISSSCNGTSKISFQATLTTPFVKRVIIPNSTDCGFVVPLPPLPPDPPPPPPVCDVVVNATSTQLTGIKSNDGTISASFTTSQVSGIATVKLFKNDVFITGVVVSLSNPEFVFEGLEAGDYIVKVGLVTFTCVGEKAITVLPMFFNEKYYFDFCESKFDKKPIKISLKKKNYSGLSSKIELAQESVLKINHESESEYKFEPIFGSSCDINLITNTEFQFADLFINQEQETLVEIFIDSVLFWTGFLTGDRATEDFKAAPYKISLSALDGIKLLKDIDFTVRDRYISFLEAIKIILDKTNLSLPFKTMVDIEDVTPNVDYKILSGLRSSVYANSIIVTDGTGVINGVPFTITGGTFDIDDLPAGVYKKTYYLIASGTSVYLSPTFDIANYAVLLISTVVRTPLSLTVEQTRIHNSDILNDHLFNTNVFVEDEKKSISCTEALEFICRQFSCSVKQSGGYWVIENIGSKARLNTKEYTYDRDLNLISSIVINLVKDIDCSQGINKVLSGANISLITGDKKATVHWKLGYPKPIFGNWNFEEWYLKNGAEVPAQWQVTEPYGWFNKGSKFDKIYDPTTGILTDVENGSYYFNIKRGTNGRQSFRTDDVIVFNQESINVNFQVIVTNKLIDYQSGSYIIGIKPKIGKYICANSRIGGGDFDPIWVIDDGSYSFSFAVDFDDTNFLPFSDQTNINLILPPSPVEGFFNIRISVSFITSVFSTSGNAGVFLSDLGFDNFKITKTSPVTNVKTIEDATITVENGNKFSNVPDDFEVLMGDVTTNLRTDGIRTLNYGITSLWKRKEVAENEALNNIICKELLSQYQQNTRIFEGEILGKEITVRNIFNLPLLDLYRFVPISFDYDVVNCIASVSMVEVYAQDGLSSGSIGGGSGGSSNVQPLGYVLASKNNIFTDGNDNLFSNGI